MPLSACSSGSATDELISSGLAPGSATVTVTVAGSAFGSRSTLRSRNENRPVTTSDITSTVVNAGRRTQNSARLIGRLPLDRACRRRLGAQPPGRAVRPSTPSATMTAPAVDALEDFNALTEAVPQFHFGGRQRSIADDEHDASGRSGSARR